MVSAHGVMKKWGKSKMTVIDNPGYLHIMLATEHVPSIKNHMINGWFILNMELDISNLKTIHIEYGKGRV